MKMIVSVISSLMVGFTLGATNFATIMELQKLLINRRKVLYSVVFAATAFFMILGALILGSIEVALQIQNQGSVVWTPLLTVALGFMSFATVAAIGARSVYPIKTAIVQPPTDQSQIVQILEFLMKSFVSGQNSTSAQADSNVQAAPAPPMAREVL